jgi:hypothetical protein
MIKMQVLRKGTGTLCEQLLMVQAFKSNVVCPNKHTTEQEVFYRVRGCMSMHGSSTVEQENRQGSDAHAIVSCP